MQDAFIYDALRTPRGKGRPAKGAKKGGSLFELPPQQLVAQVVDGLRVRNPNFESELSSLTLGCVGQVGAQGGHIGLVSRLAANLPEVSVQTLNNHCASGLTAVNNSILATQAGRAGLHLAGGVECLSQVGFLADKASYYSDPATIRALRWAPPIMGAELVATIEGFSKSDLDEISLWSHQRAASAWANGRFDAGVIAVKNSSGEVMLEQDELVRADLSMQALEAMPPAFAEQGAQGFDAMMLAEFAELDQIKHLHSIANCPGMADGAALVLLGCQQAGEAVGLKPKAKVLATAEAADNVILQFGAGFKAMEQALEQSGLSLQDMDRIEFMESFAAVPIKFLRDYDVDADKVNVNGGHLAMGHPMGATGAILINHVVHELQRSQQQFGLVVASAGGGLGAAMVVERLDS